MKYAVEIATGIILIFFVYSITDNIGSSNYKGEIINRNIDTIWSKPDTVISKDTITVTKLKAVLDTVIIEGKPVRIAAADTAIKNDSLCFMVNYYFPPLNYFDIEYDLLIKTIKDTVTILDSVTIEKPEPFYKDNWFWSTVGLIILLINNMVN